LKDNDRSCAGKARERNSYGFKRAKTCSHGNLISRYSVGFLVGLYEGVWFSSVTPSDVRAMEKKKGAAFMCGSSMNTGAKDK
jgi:hypothetical protein